MKERELNFQSASEHPELVVLNPKETKEAKKQLDNILLAASAMDQELKNCRLSVGYRNTLLNVLEIYLVDLQKAFQYESVLRKEREERCVEIKKVNTENRDLRRQLGEKVSAEDVRERLKNMTETINKWWKAEGFGYVRSVNYHPYICEVNLSCTMCVHFDEGHPDKLKAKGYVIENAEGNGNWQLLHSDANIKLLNQEVVKRFPSATLQTIEVRNWKTQHINEYTFLIHDYSDI